MQPTKVGGEPVEDEPSDCEEDWMFRTFDGPKGGSRLKVDKKALDPFAEDCAESFDEPSLKLPGQSAAAAGSGAMAGCGSLNEFMS